MRIGLSKKQPICIISLIKYETRIIFEKETKKRSSLIEPETQTSLDLQWQHRQLKAVPEEHKNITFFQQQSEKHMRIVYSMTKNKVFKKHASRPV